MIHLAAEFVPSLLFFQNSPSTANSNLAEASKHLEAGDLSAAEACAQKARKSSQKARVHQDHAAALVTLSDIYRDMGRLGPALRYALEAYTILKNQASLAQRHNEMITAYSIGLLHHLLGDEEKAQEWYQTALQLLQPVQEQWVTRNKTTWVRTCRRLEQWIHTLQSCRVRVEECYGFHSTVVIPVGLANGGGGPLSTAELRVTGYLLGPNLTIGDKAFHVQAANGDDVVFATEGEYRIFEIPESVCSKIGAQIGDYVLMRLTDEKDLTVSYYAVEGATGPDFGRFRRDSADGVVFESVATGQMIGSTGDLPTYYPVALLRSED